MCVCLVLIHLYWSHWLNSPVGMFLFPSIGCFFIDHNHQHHPVFIYCLYKMVLIS